ncbi:MAG: glycosyltransferase [Gluconacetobacter sp.]
MVAWPGLAWPGRSSIRNFAITNGEGFSRFRDVFKLLPGYRRTREAANAIIVDGRSALAEIPRRWRAKTIYLPENGYDPARFPTPPVRTADAYVARPLRAIFIGRLVPYKGCALLLEAAAALMASGRLTLDIIGDGPENGRLRQLAGDLGIETGVRFLGECCHRVSMQHLVGADILTFPSLREFGGAVVLEAMAMGWCRSWSIMAGRERWRRRTVPFCSR